MKNRICYWIALVAYWLSLWVGNAQLTTAFRTVSVNTNGTLRGPTNFVAANDLFVGRRFSTLAAMVAAQPPNTNRVSVYLEGRLAPNDGGEGWFDYDATSTVATNLGMVFSPASGVGRYLRRWETEVIPQWFGADDSGNTDAAPALQAAITFASRPTYGWQSNVGGLAATGYAGTFTVKCNGFFSLYSEVEISGGVILEGKPGVTWGEKGGHTFFLIRHGGSGFVINLYDLSQGYRIGGIKHVIMMGEPETYQPNKKAITSVISRLSFRVTDADAPPPLDDIIVRPGNNTCFFYDDQGEYLGSARITSTSSSGGFTTVNLHNGTDCFSSINGSPSRALTTSCKVVWPVRVTDEFTAVSPAFNDPSLSGSVGVNVRNKRTGFSIGAGTPVLEDITTWTFHTGFRFGPGTAGSLSPMRDLRSTRSKFAGFASARPENCGDYVFTGTTYSAGFYQSDFVRPLTSSGSITVTPGTPAVFTKTAHGFVAGSLIRFGAETIPTGLIAGHSYYVNSTGLTANTFEVSTSHRNGSSVAVTDSGTGLYIAGNVIDYPALQWSTYGMYGAQNHARFDNTIMEFNAYAGVYAFRTISPSFRYLFCDGLLRHGIVLNAGYSEYANDEYSNWMGVDHLDAQPSFSVYPYDNYHTNRNVVYFEPTTSDWYAGIAIGHLNTQWQSGSPKFTHAFDLQHSSYNNRAKVGKLLGQNAYTAWYNNAPGKAPEVDTPALSTATDVSTGWYTPSFEQRDFASVGTRLMSLTSGNALIEKSNGSQLFTLKNVGNSNAVTFSVGTGSLSIDETLTGLRLGLFYSDLSQVVHSIGSTANSGTARASQLAGEAMSGTDKSSGNLQIVGNKGTGAGTSGDIEFYTGITGASGSTGHSLGVKAKIPMLGGFRIVASAADITANGVGHINYVSGSVNNFRFYDRDSWQPLSPNSAEQSVASASTTQLAQSTSEKIFVTGTSGIASFGSAQSGVRRFLRFEGALTMTNSASLVLPGGVNITTAAGDTAETHSFGSSSWRVVFFQRSSGEPIAEFKPLATINVDANATFTFTPWSGANSQVLTAPITAARTVTLSTVGARNGYTGQFTRSASATGAFNWDIGGLKNLTPGTWCVVRYDGSAWILTASGTL